MSNYLITLFNKELNQEVEFLYRLDDGLIEAIKITFIDKKVCLEINNKANSLTPKEKKILNFFLEQRGKVISFNNLSEIFPYDTPETLAVLFSKTSSKFKIDNQNLDDFNQKINSEFLFNYNKRNAALGQLKFLHNYQIIGTIEQNEMNKEKFENNRISESSISHTELMTILMEKKPLLSDLLYKIGTSNYLPFIKIDTTIKFPLLINNNVESIQHNWKDSYKQEREGLGARMYDGSNLRALQIQNNQLIVAKSSYFSVLDSADYIASRLKVYHHQKNNKEFQRVFEIWSNRLQNIQNNFSFDSYNSGIAFSIPIFQIAPDNSLRVLAAKGSQFKATGSGKRHVAPAGMLEFFSYHNTSEISFAEFRTLCAKELLEETVFGQESLELDSNNPFYMTLLPFFETLYLRSQDSMSFSALSACIETIFNEWEAIWKSLRPNNVLGHNNIPNCVALSAILNMSEEEFSNNSFFVLDFANLRPEFIVPIYINEPLNQIVNWEYEQKNNYTIENDILKFKDLDELNYWAKNEINEYCAPALAAIYLGAQRFFIHKLGHG